MKLKVAALGSLLFFFAIVVAGEYFNFTHFFNSPKVLSQTTYNRALVTINGSKQIVVEIAQTPEQKSKGLGGRTSLSDSEGMLFPFSERSYVSFWMKGMKMPIDIIWIDGDTIVGIEENVPPQPGIPDSQLTRYHPNQPISHVLEVRAGYARDHGIATGSKVTIEKAE